MIVVDTSVWAAYFNGVDAPECRRLIEVLDHEGDDLAVLPIIVTEVLQGFRSDSTFRKAEILFRGLTVVNPSIDTHVEAARLFRALRRHGVTVRGAVDCLIARTCIELDTPLLTLDRDFRQIAKHAPLMLASAS